MGEKMENANPLSTMHSSIQEFFSGTPASNPRELRLHLNVMPTSAGVFKSRHILLHKYVNKIMITYISLVTAVNISMLSVLYITHLLQLY
jgi:hypothetical protein